MTDRRPSRRQQDEDSDSDHEPIHIQCWIPGEGIDVTVLAAYLKEYIDDTATIRQSRSPQDREKTGFTISAQATISVEGLRDVIKDSKLWAIETKSREYRRDPYTYSDSDTWIARKRSGATPGHQNPRKRRRRAAVADQTSSASEPPQQRQGAGGGRHADVPPPYSLPRNDPSPTRPPRPGGPDPDSYNRLTKDLKNVQLVDDNQRPGANQSTKLQTTTSRHAATKDDDTRTGNRLPVATAAKTNIKGSGGRINDNNNKDSRHDERSYSYH